MSPEALKAVRIMPTMRIKRVLINTAAGERNLPVLVNGAEGQESHPYAGAAGPTESADLHVRLIIRAAKRVIADPDAASCIR
jgi:hypothetical protein